MSNEHTESNPTPNTNQQTRRRRRNRKRGPRTIRWYHDAVVGAEFAKQNVVLKFFISIDEKETPEIFFIPMHREMVSGDDGVVGMKPLYAGDIEKNAVPLSLVDLKSMWDALVTVKSRMIKMQEEHYGRKAEGKVPEASPEITAQVTAVAKKLEAREPKPQPRSQLPVQPLMHRMRIPPGVVAKVEETVEEPPVQPTEAPKTSLADALKGW